MTDNEHRARNEPDEQLHRTAAAVRSCLPPWFTKLTVEHTEQAQQLHDSGRIADAVIFAKHYPLFHDGVICGAHETDEAYPCPVLNQVGLLPMAVGLFFDAMSAAGNHRFDRESGVSSLEANEIVTALLAAGWRVPE